jgi:hypothetical protein
MRFFYQSLYWAVRRLAFGLYGLSKRLDWLCHKLYAKAEFKGSVGRRQKGKIF